MEIIILQGESGAGKTYSLRNLNPKQGIFITQNTKGLSFKGRQKFQQKLIPELKDIPAYIRKYAEGGAKWIVVEDFTHWISARVMSEEFRLQGATKSHAFTRYEQLAHDMYAAVFALSAEITKPTRVILLSHTTSDDNGKQVFKTAGKMLDEKIIPPSYCNIVLHAIMTDDDDPEKKYRILTQGTQQYQAKSLPGMFPAHSLPNDMVKIFEYMDAFDRDEAEEIAKEKAEAAQKKVTKPAAEPVAQATE